MSNQSDTVTTVLVSFLTGALFGAAAGLLLAPSSGQELRTKIRDEAEADWRRATAEWEKAKAETQAALDQMRAEAQAAQIKALEEVRARLDELQKAQSEASAPSGEAEEAASP